MADIWGALAQVSPTATTLTDSYTVPALKHATVEVVICNRGAATTVRLAYAIAGAVDDLSQYLLYNFAVGANEAKSTAPITMNAADLLRVYSTSGNVSFTTYGIEEDN